MSKFDEMLRAHTRPTSLLLGMNKFLRLLDITFRRDSMNYRPRINKKNSVKVCANNIIVTLLIFVTWYHLLLLQDTEQKKSGNFFFLET